jgi:uncharacterized membrane protein
MRRKEFLRTLREELRKRRDIEIEEVIYYYDELIQDAVDNGEDESEFIRKVGSVKDISRRITDDSEFIIRVKQKNLDSIRNVVGLTVKIVGYFIFSIIAFTIIVTSFSLFVSGLGIIVQTLVRMIASPPVDNYGYIMLFGFITVGISLVFISIGLSQIFFRQAKPALLSIFRKVNDLLRREGN